MARAPALNAVWSGRGRRGQGPQSIDNPAYVTHRGLDVAPLQDQLSVGVESGHAEPARRTPTGIPRSLARTTWVGPRRQDEEDKSSFRHHQDCFKITVILEEIL